MHIMKETLAKEHPYTYCIFGNASWVCNISVYNLLMNFKSGDLQ